jgi:hypothetical protein
MTIPLPEPVNFSDVWLPGKDEFNRQHAVWGHTADQLHARDAQWRAIVAAEVAKERERIRTAIMAQHAAAKGQHNLYHCLAVELFGDAAIRKGE